LKSRDGITASEWYDVIRELAFSLASIAMWAKGSQRREEQQLQKAGRAIEQLLACLLDDKAKYLLEGSHAFERRKGTPQHGNKGDNSMNSANDPRTKQTGDDKPTARAATRETIWPKLFVAVVGVILGAVITNIVGIVNDARQRNLNFVNSQIE
jgi:type II secretory pathway pseudopilin PulG